MQHSHTIVNLITARLNILDESSPSRRRKGDGLAGKLPFFGSVFLNLDSAMNPPIQDILTLQMGGGAE